MDPKAALDAAENALNSGDRFEAREYLANYASWRRGGGFQPAGGDARHAALAKRLRSRKPVSKNSRKARLRHNAEGETGGTNWLLIGGLAVGGYLAWCWLSGRNKTVARSNAVQAKQAPPVAPSNVGADRAWAAYQAPSNSLKLFEFPPEQPGLPSPRAAHDRFWSSLTDSEKAEGLRLYSMTPEQIRAMEGKPDQYPLAVAFMGKLMTVLEQLTTASSAPTPPAKTGTSGIGNYYNDGE